MKCIQCGRTIPNDSRFCKYCGVRLSRTCAACGAALDDDAVFCSACGAEVPDGRTVELDISKNVPELSASDMAGVAPNGSNVSGFYFSHRISKKNKASAQQYFDVNDKTLVYLEGSVLSRFDKEGELVKHVNQTSLDTSIEALSILPDGNILAAGFDWGSGDSWKIMLWKFDDAMNVFERTEVFAVDADIEQQSWRMRLTDTCLFVFSWDNYDKGRRTILKYDFESRKVTQKTISGKRTYLWFANGEKIYFRGEGTVSGVDERGEPIVSDFFGVIDTAPEEWTVRRIWTFGEGPDEVPNGSVYIDFGKNIVWSHATRNERNANGYDADIYVARELAPGYKILSEYPVWKLPNTTPQTLFFDYFDGKYAFKAKNVLVLDNFDREGTEHHWKYTVHGDTENTIVWGDDVLVDLTSLGYRVYPITADGPEDISADGFPLRNMPGFEAYSHN